jgi:hypothetical protein
MERKDLQKRLQVTRSQVKLLEQCMACAEESEKDLHPVIYKAMILGYKSLISDLQQEITKYEKELEMN